MGQSVLKVVPIILKMIFLRTALVRQDLVFTPL